MSNTCKCSRCGAVMKQSEWDEHICEDLRPLSDLPDDLLAQVATKKITEAEAWTRFDARTS